MASVMEPDGLATTLPSPDSDEMTVMVAEARSDMERAIQIAGLKNDPLAPLLRAVAATLEVQHRLHQANTRHLRDMGEQLSHQGRQAASLSESGMVSTETVLVSRLAPLLASATDRTVRARLWTIKFRTIAAACAGTAALVLVCLASGYALGHSAGHAQAVRVGQTLTASAGRDGPQAAAMWAQLVTNNDIRSAMAECEKTVARQEGRKACSLPVWLEPPSPPAALGR